MTLADRLRELAAREQPQRRDVVRYHLCPGCQQVNPWPPSYREPPRCDYCDKVRS